MIACYEDRLGFEDANRIICFRKDIEFVWILIHFNEDSLKFHLAVGFEEANRIICFRKGL